MEKQSISGMLLAAFLLLLPGISTSICAQCPVEDIILSTQTEIDLFPFTYPSCTMPGVKITIQDDNDGLDNINDVDGLLSITSIADLEISANNTLTNLDGLANLTSLADALIIADNASLTELDGLSGLTSIGKDIFISGNGSLQNIDGLSGLSTVSGFLSISDNAALNDLDGLDNLNAVVEFFNIANNDALSDLDDLSSLTTVGGDLFIVNNDALQDIDGLSSLTSLGTELSISGNSVLVDVNGLSGLTNVSGFINLADNAALTNVNGLSNLVSVAQYLNILNNDALTNVNGLSSLTSITGDLIISGNNMLMHVDGLSALNSIGGDFDLTLNTSLSNVNGLKGLHTIGEDFFLSDNPALVNVDSLDELTTLGGDFFLSDNSSLLNVDGLKGLSALHGILSITDNSSLLQIDGLANVTTVNEQLIIERNSALVSVEGLVNLGTIVEFLSVSSNPSLNVCCGLFPFLTGTDLPVSINIFDNQPGCNTQLEIIAGGSCFPDPSTFNADLCNAPPLQMVWNPFPGAVMYEFKAASLNMSQQLNTIVQEPKVVFNGIVPNGFAINFQLRFQYVNGNWSDWSPLTQYTYSCDCETVDVSSFTGVICDNSVQFSWDGIAGTTEYEFFASSVNTNHQLSRVVNQPSVVYNGSLPEGFLIQYQIRARCDNGLWGPWTPLTLYTINAGDEATCPPLMEATSNTTEQIAQVLQLGESNRSDHLEVFPVPGLDRLTIRAKIDLASPTMELYDISGRIIHSESTGALAAYTSLTIDISAIAPGNYWLRVVDVSQSYIVRVIKM